MGPSTALAPSSSQQFLQIKDYLLSKQRAIGNVAPKYFDTALQQDSAVDEGDVVRAHDWHDGAPVIDAETVEEPAHDPDTGEVHERDADRASQEGLPF